MTSSFSNDDMKKSWQHLRKRCEDLKLLRSSLVRPSLRHEKKRSFLFSRLDLLKRTDPGEAVRNVEYAISVSITIIMDWDLWKSIASALIYIDVSVRMSPDALFFFGHLLSRFNLHEAADSSPVTLLTNRATLRNERYSANQYNEKTILQKKTI
jgi:hypothetical protein